MTNTVLDIRLARLVTGGNPELERLVAEYFIAGSPKKLSEFLRSAPASGAALLELFHEHGGSFETFVDKVVDGRYLWYGVGWTFGNLLISPILLVRTLPMVICAIFEGLCDIESDDALLYDLGFGMPSIYTDPDSPSQGFIESNDTPEEACDISNDEAEFGL